MRENGGLRDRMKESGAGNEGRDPRERGRGLRGMGEGRGKVFRGYERGGERSRRYEGRNEGK